MKEEIVRNGRGEDGEGDRSGIIAIRDEKPA